MSSHSDSVVPFVFESLPLRGAIVQLSASWQRLLAGHDYRAPVRDVLGHAAAATVLLAQSLKADSSVTLQINGDGPLSMLVMQCTSELRFRGLASAAGETGGLSYPDLVSRARCAITVDNKASERPYQGIVEVTGDSLAASLEGYYLRSAQLPSHLRLVADETVCGGILLQQVPDRNTVEADDWRRLGFLAATLTSTDLESGVGADLIGKLFAADDVRVFEPRATAFRCRCSRERAAAVLKLLGKEESESACRDHGRLLVTCEYCGRRQKFDAVDIEALFADITTPRSDALH